MIVAREKVLRNEDDKMVIKILTYCIYFSLHTFLKSGKGYKINSLVRVNRCRHLDQKE